MGELGLLVYDILFGLFFFFVVMKDIFGLYNNMIKRLTKKILLILTLHFS